LLGNPSVHTLVLRQPQEVPLYASLGVEQGGDPVTTVVSKYGGLVSLALLDPRSSVPFDAASHDFDWSQSSMDLALHGETSAEVLVDPTQLAAGESYHLRVIVTE